MEKEEFVSRLNLTKEKCEEQREMLYAMVAAHRALKNEYIEEYAKFKPGDKVIFSEGVGAHAVKSVGYIGKVICDYDVRMEVQKYTGSFKYDIFNARQDGTMGKRHICYVLENRIEAFRDECSSH